MAPSRKRASAKSTAAAAACRQWNVGDLVLAKVKGFPAWPATVSEPKKWGYSADWKKVLVCFFGTQQIAFCNPADVEAFTEEKKQSLLSKRQGRGADFLRAVQEIVDSYDKSREMTQVNDFNSDHEHEIADSGISVPQEASVELKKLSEMSEVTLTCRNSVLPLGDDISLGQAGHTLCKKEGISGKPVEDGDGVISTIATYKSRKRSGSMRSRKPISQTKTPSIDGPRSLFSSDSCRLQNSTGLPVDGEGSSADMLAKIELNGSLERNLPLRSSPDVAECDNLASSAVVSNGSMEDNGSEIVTATSDYFGLIDAGTMTSCGVEQHGSVDECVGDDTELRRGIDFKIKAVFVKKKRKPNRKRISHDAGEVSARLEPNDLAIGMHNAHHSLLSTSGNENENSSKEIGDEHLPLLKRARVRMGKLSSSLMECDGLPETDSKTSEERSNDEGTHSMANQTSPSKKCSSDCPDGLLLFKDLDNALSLNTPMKQLHSKEDHSFVCSTTHDASSLPSSKCSVLAMEAITRNSQECSSCTKVSTTNILSSCCSLSSSRISTLVDVEKRASTFSEAKNVISLADEASVLFDVPTENHMSKEFSKVEENNANKEFHDLGGDRGDGELKNSNGPDHSSVLQEKAATKILVSNSGMEMLPNSAEDAHCKMTKPLIFKVNSNCRTNDLNEVEKGSRGRQQEKEGNACTSGSINFVQNGSRSHNTPKQMKTVSTLVADGKNKSSSFRLKSIGKWSKDEEALLALLSFERMLESLTRTKESIGQATRVAMNCAKFNLTSKVIDTLAHSLERESSLHRRVDLFFLVDSIAQCSHGLRGDVAGSFSSAIEAVLPRLLVAAAPSGCFAQENRRQCLKVLKVWLERKVLPESVVSLHIRELNTVGASYSIGTYSRRSSRTERALDDPVRDMEGMLVDEYGSNSSFHLPGLSVHNLFEEDDEGSDSDEGYLEAVTPEHVSDTAEELHAAAGPSEKRMCILEDVDGELEMEDLAPRHELAMNTTLVASLPVPTAPNSHDHFAQHLLPAQSHIILPTPPPVPPLPPPPLPPSSSHNSTVHGESQQPVAAAPTPVQPNISPSLSSRYSYHTPEYGRGRTQLCSSPTNSFGSHHPTCPPSFVPRSADDCGSHFKEYVPRPPRPTPSGQFSYIRAVPHPKPQMDVPAPCPQRSRYSTNTDGKLYHNRERMRPPPCDHGDCFKAPFFSGRRNYDKPKPSYGPVSHGESRREPNRWSYQRWAYPPRGMHHRSFISSEPHHEASGFWHPR